VLALLGENGAGKSTLVSILFGHYVADEGTIEAFGQPLPPGQPKAALAMGIGMVHQHFTLADNLSVLDNVMLGTEPLWWPFSRRAAARAKLVETGQRFGLGVDPDARIADLSVGERQRVEILKALVRGARFGPQRAFGRRADEVRLQFDRREVRRTLRHVRDRRVAGRGVGERNHRSGMQESVRREELRPDRAFHRDQPFGNIHDPHAEPARQVVAGPMVQFLGRHARAQWHGGPAVS